MPREFFDPTPEQHNIVVVSAVTLHMAVKLIQSCEQCNREGAGVTAVLARLALSHPFKRRSVVPDKHYNKNDGEQTAEHN